MGRAMINGNNVVWGRFDDEKPGFAPLEQDFRLVDSRLGEVGSNLSQVVDRLSMMDVKLESLEERVALLRNR